MKKLFLISYLLMSVLMLNAQKIVVSSVDSLRKDALNVFMDVNDFIRKEIPFVNYVRDIKDARVYIISSSQQTGSGGREITYFLTGQHEYIGMNDTLTTVSSPDDTQDQRREREVNILKMGLMRYVSKTPLAKHINIQFTQPLSEEVSIDKWDSWVLSARVNGHFSGQKTYNSSNIYGSFAANRITPNWKLRFNINYSRGTDKFEIDDEIIRSVSRSKSFSTLIVKSLTEHWSAGINTRIGSATYNNQELHATILPSIEYDIFPYSESTRRQLRILYSIGLYQYQYSDTTIYDKTEEKLLGHELSAAYEVVQKWGSIEMSMRWKNYFFDWNKNNFMIDGYLNIRVAKGLSVNLGGYYQLIHDQLALVKGGATTDEILLQRKELETSFSFFTHFGITYTFGSIYNNVVNPRFGR